MDARGSFRRTFLAPSRLGVRSFLAAYSGCGRGPQYLLRIGGIVCLSLALAATLLAPATPARENGQSTDARYLDGLRQRQLYRLAEVYCEQRLTEPRLDAVTAAEMVVQLSQTLQQHARQAPLDAAGPIWSRAVQVVDDFVIKNPGSPWLTVVQIQGSLVHVSRGEMLRQIAELSGNNPKRTQEALEKLRIGIHLLRQYDSAIEEALRRSARPNVPGPSRVQLLNVQRNLRYQLARAYRNQAQCYAAASPDRDNALRQAIELFGPVARLDLDDEVVWDSGLEEVRCYRLMANKNLALRRLEQLEAQQPPPAIALEARGERIRLLIDDGETAAALALADENPTRDGLSSAKLDYARLEAVLAAWEEVQATDKAKAQQLEGKIQSLIRHIQETHEPYWSLLADTLLARTRMTAGLSGDVALLARAADGYLRGGQVEKAIELYEQAAAKSREKGQNDQAFDMGYMAASIEHEQKHYAKAKARFRALATTFRENPLACEAHLLAIFNAGQEAQQKQPPALDEYVQVAEEHIQIWPRSPTANHARWYVGRVRESQRKWDEAVAVYKQISPDHERFAPAIEAISHCFEAQLTEREAVGESTTSVGRSAAQLFEGLFLNAQGGLPERWSPTERQAALAAARMRMNYCDRDYRRASQILAAALQRGPEPDPQWKEHALAASVAALAGEDRMDQAGQAIAAIQSRDGRLWLTMMEDLARTSRALPERALPAVGKLQLQAAKNISHLRAEFDAPSQKRYDLLSAQATAMSGDTAKAIQLFDKLAQDHARDAGIQEALGRLLVDSNDKQMLNAALNLWRDVAKKSREATPLWFRARYYTALAHHKLGNRDQSTNIVRTVAALHPELGGPELKAKFQELLKK